MIPLLLAASFLVIDGDTIRVSEETIRLYAIDAPEDGQTCLDAAGAEYDCGAEATAALKRILANRAVAIRRKGKDRYGRTVAILSDVNCDLVSGGYAWAYARYGALCVEAEADARRAGRGVFAHPDNIVPWEWRRYN